MKLSKYWPRATRSRSTAMPAIGLFLLSSLVALTLASSAGAAVTFVPLGTADSFAVLAGSTVTNTGPTVVTGDLGVSPGSAVTGFPVPGTVIGTIHAADAVALQAQTDLTIAYNNAAGQGPTSPIVADLGGQTLTAGVYNSGSSIGLTGTVTLNGEGNPNAVFVFQAGSTLTTASASQVSLINGAQSCNVFWQVGSSATLGTGSTFRGSILALQSITVTTGVTVDGRVLARNGAVTLDSDLITKPTCAVPPPPPPVCEFKSIVNGPPKQLIIKTQALGGLKSIVVNQSTNANTPVPSFTLGTTSEVDVTSTKINQSLGSTVVLTVTDMNNNVIHCDPVFATVSVKHLGKPSAQSYSHLARAESKVRLINSKLGVRMITLKVNGHTLKPLRLAPSQTRNVNVARWMRPGNNNRITVVARGSVGSSATVLISD